MKISRGFVKIFLTLFLIFVIGSIISLFFDYYSSWIGYTIIGGLVFIGVLLINKKMPRFGKFLILLFVLSIIIIVVAQNINLNFSDYFPNKEKSEYVNVTNILSGDTFEIGEDNRLWLACVIAPDLDEEGYEESKTFLEELILEKEIKIKHVKDKSQSLEGAVYVFLDIDGTEIFVNKEMITNGFGNYYEEDSENDLCKSLSE